MKKKNKIQIAMQYLLFVNCHNLRWKIINKNLIRKGKETENSKLLQNANTLQEDITQKACAIVAIMCKEDRL